MAVAHRPQKSYLSPVSCPPKSTNGVPLARTNCCPILRPVKPLVPWNFHQRHHHDCVNCETYLGLYVACFGKTKSSEHCCLPLCGVDGPTMRWCIVFLCRPCPLSLPVTICLPRQSPVAVTRPIQKAATMAAATTAATMAAATTAATQRCFPALGFRAYPVLVFLRTLVCVFKWSCNWPACNFLG